MRDYAKQKSSIISEEQRLDMVVELGINYTVEDFEQALKWYGLLYKDKHPSKTDERIYHKLNILVDSMKFDEKMEAIDND